MRACNIMYQINCRKSKPGILKCFEYWKQPLKYGKIPDYRKISVIAQRFAQFFIFISNVFIVNYFKYIDNLHEHIIVKVSSRSSRWSKVIKISTISSLSFNLRWIKRIKSCSRDYTWHWAMWSYILRISQARWIE